VSPSTASTTGCQTALPTSYWLPKASTPPPTHTHTHTFFQHHSLHPKDGGRKVLQNTTQCHNPARPQLETTGSGRGDTVFETQMCVKVKEYQPHIEPHVQPTPVLHFWLFSSAWT
jgi:hypothetical protein